MAHMHLPSEVPVRYLPRSAGATALTGAMIFVGLVAFVIRLSQDPQAAWIAYVSNWLFFTSISMGGVILAVATWITKAKWNWSVRRVSQSLVAFLPISFVLLLPMLTLREGYFPWIEEMAHDPILQAKAAYLNIPFLISRNVVGLLLLFGLAIYFVYLALRPDMGLTEGHEEGDAGRATWRDRLTPGWMGQEQEEVHSYQMMTRVGPVIVLAYALVMSIVAYDWAMSATVLWSLYLRNKHVDFKNLIGLQQRHDLGKLAFAFTVFWTYLWFSQYIVIWYGKLEWEQAWIIRRSGETWGGFSALIMVMCFLVPFAGLMGRKAKMKPMLLATFTTIILTGLWLERYALIAPSLHHEGDPIFTIWQPLIGLMFLGLWLSAIRWFLTTFPAIQLWQPMVDAETIEVEQPVEVSGD
jgi:hypothetical protein